MGCSLRRRASRKETAACMKEEPLAVNWSLSHLSRLRYSRRDASAASSMQNGGAVASSTTLKPRSSCG
jgi:hypothetical protein